MQPQAQAKFPYPPRNLVVLESPYRGFGETREEIEQNCALHIAYARLCLRNSVLRGESPIASHLLYTQRGVLDDNNPEERKLGIACGLVWLPHADYGVFYTDKGWSHGMLSALVDIYLGIGFDFRIRSIFGKSHIQLPKKQLCDATISKLIPKCED